MVIEYKFHFKSATQLPSVEALFNELKESTGLDDIVLNNDSIRHPSFDNQYFGVFITPENKQVMLWTDVLHHVVFGIEYCAIGGSCTAHVEESTSLINWSICSGELS